MMVAAAARAGARAAQYASSYDGRRRRQGGREGRPIRIKLWMVAAAARAGARAAQYASSYDGRRRQGGRKGRPYYGRGISAAPAESRKANIWLKQRAACQQKQARP